MRQHLSSRMTFFYKVYGLLWGLLSIASVTALVIAKENPLYLLLLLAFLLPTIITYKLSKVTFDDNFVYVKTWFKEVKYKLKNVKSINEGDIMTMDPFFQLEIISDDKRTIEKIEFAPKEFESLEYFFRKKYGGQLLMFKRHVEWARDYEQNP